MARQISLTMVTRRLPEESDVVNCHLPPPAPLLVANSDSDDEANMMEQQIALSCAEEICAREAGNIKAQWHYNHR